MGRHSLSVSGLCVATLQVVLTAMLAVLVVIAASAAAAFAGLVLLATALADVMRRARPQQARATHSNMTAQGWISVRPFRDHKS